eukprot:m.5726 g.5726  ORF g.5726 m.5726 type:complete len:100 (-) comp5082_c0_seq1:1923-2222(-)
MMQTLPVLSPVQVARMPLCAQTTKRQASKALKEKLKHMYTSACCTFLCIDGKVPKRTETGTIHSISHSACTQSRALKIQIGDKAAHPNSENKNRKGTFN